VLRTIVAALSRQRGGAAPVTQECLDLTHSVEPTLFLLRDTRAWRQRLVESYTYYDAAHVRVSSSYQVELPPDFVARFVPHRHSSVNVLVPLTTREKQALIGFDVEVGDGQGFLLPRRAGADVQTAYLLQLRDTSSARPVDLAGLTPALLYAISWFTPATWQEFRADAYDDIDALTRYLADGLGLAVWRAHVALWVRRSDECAQTLQAALREPPSDVSGSENVLLALPGVDPLPQTVEEVDTIVDGYVRGVEAARSAGDDDFLSVLAEYGRRWEVIVEAQLATERPTMMRIGEDRPLGLDAGGRVVAHVALGDAASMHFEARVGDPHVAVVGPLLVTDLHGDPVGVPLLESARVTDEAVSLYSSVPDRPYYIRVQLTLRPSAYLRVMANAVLWMTVSAVVATLLLDATELVGRLSLVLLPSTFAVAFVLTREETPLAARLQTRYRRRIAVAVAVLWLVALTRIVAVGSVLPRLAQLAKTAAEWIR
jgi:hypothetical protein